MNNKSMFVVLLLCGLILAAVLARNGEVLLLAMPLLVYLIVGILGCPGRITLEALRTVERTDIAAQEPVKIQILVKNNGDLLPSLHLADPVLSALTVVEGQKQQTIALPAGETAALEYVATGARGLYRWSSVSASGSDPLGLFELRREIPCPAQLQIRPTSMKLRNLPIRPRSTLHAPGSTPARLSGSSTDFWQVREYRPGDALRRINWRLAGRYPRRLFTNEYEGQEIADFGFIVDARRLTNAPQVDEALFESSLSAAGALAETFLKNGNRVALLIFGEAPAYLFPGYGKRQLNRVLHELSGARLGRNLPGHYLEYFPARLFPSRSVLLMFSAVDTGDLETYRRLRSFGYDILLISPDPIEYASRSLSPGEINHLALRAARLERAVQLQAIMEVGLAVIDWQVDQPLDVRLQSTAREMARRRNL